VGGVIKAVVAVSFSSPARCSFVQSSRSRTWPTLIRILLCRVRHINIGNSNGKYQNEGRTKLRSWLRFLYRIETNLLIPELVKIEAKRTLLILHLRKIEAKRILFIPQIRKIEAERTLFIPQIGQIEAKRSLFIPQIRKNEAERSLFIPQIGQIEAKRSLFIPQIRKIEAERTRLIPEIGKIEAKKTNLIEVKRTEAVFLKLLWSTGIDSKES